jgi:hypothetical protein
MWVLVTPSSETNGGERMRLATHLGTHYTPVVLVERMDSQNDVSAELLVSL